VIQWLGIVGRSMTNVRTEAALYLCSGSACHGVKLRFSQNFVRAADVKSSLERGMGERVSGIRGCAYAGIPCEWVNDGLAVRGR
jgi:aromatic ring-opening dioxygenase catalytic subunit (LigB family)